jgi:hypothetical protein
VAATWDEGQHDVVAKLQIVHTGPNFFHSSCRFMPHGHGSWARPHTVDRRQIRVTKSGGADFDQNLPVTRRIKIKHFDGQWHGSGKGSLGSRLVQDRSSDFHKISCPIKV